MRSRALTLAACLVAVTLALPAPAQAASRVSVSNEFGNAKIDPTYATAITVSGSGFQSIPGGHGGIYVVFGTQKSGQNLYVPDSETKSNQGFQRFVAFPGGDTSSSANGGTISKNGNWSTSMVVPGASFRAIDRNGRATTVDCRKVTCGIITFGAHGVRNSKNETFTPLSFANLHDGSPAAAGDTASGTPLAAGEGNELTDAEDTKADEKDQDAKKPSSEKAALAVDRATAVAGRVLTFTASGLEPGEQVVATLDDGIAAVGPLTVGPNGQIAGVLALPENVDVGTHELRLSRASGDQPSVAFPISAETRATAATTGQFTDDWLPIVVAALTGVLLIGTIAFAVIRVRSSRTRSSHAV